MITMPTEFYLWVRSYEHSSWQIMGSLYGYRTPKEAFDSNRGSLINRAYDWLILGAAPVASKSVPGVLA